MSAPLSNFQRVSPVLLSASCDVLNNNQASPDMGQLAYPFRKAVVIDEIRFDLSGSQALVVANLGALVSAKLQLGRHYLMRDPVPVWLLGTTMAIIEEQDPNSALNTLAVPFNYSHFRWKLPQPLYVEAGEVLRCTMIRSGGITVQPTTITCQVSYAGWVCSPKQPRPSVLAVPYAAAFVTQTIGTVSASPTLSYAESNENHLFNPFDIPLRIQRLTGRVVFKTANGFSVTQVAAYTPVVQSGTTMLVQMFDSWGNKMVNDLTGPSDVFDASRCAWTVDTELPAKGIYVVKAWNLNTSVNSTTQQLHVGMVGMREEPL